MAAVVLLMLLQFITGPDLHAADTNSEKTSNVQPGFALENVELSQLITDVMKATGRKFVVDPSVRGKITIFSSKPLDQKRLYGVFLQALRINGFSLVEQGDVSGIQSARNIQRGNTPVSKSLPDLADERMVNHVFTLRNLDAENINKTLRILPSRDGEMTPLIDQRSLLVADFTGNLHRIGTLLKVLDSKSFDLKPAPERAPPAWVAGDAPSAVSFNFVDADIIAMLKTLSSWLNRPLIIDPSVRGKVNIVQPGPISPLEAVRSALIALAQNGYTVVDQGEFLKVVASRNAQRDALEVVTELPDIRDERQFNYVVPLKHVSADAVMKSMQILPSRDGEMSLVSGTNVLIFSDYTSNLHRIDKLLKEIDVPGAKTQPAAKKSSKAGTPGTL